MLSGAALAAVAIPATYHFFGKIDYPRALASPDSLTPIMDLKERREIGLTYRAQVPDESGERGVAKRLLDKLSTNPGTLTASMDGVIKKDFANGDVVEVKGWILSRTEARQCALLSFTPMPSQQ